MKNNQKGFSAVEAIIIIIVIALLALGGWFVWQSNNEKDNTAKDSPAAANENETTNSQNNQEDSATKLTTKLTSYTKKFSVMLPDGWKFTNDTELDYAHAIGLENMTYKEGTPATVVSEVGHRGGGLNVASVVIESMDASDAENYFSASEEQEPIKTSTGLPVQKYIYTAKEGDETLAAGSKSYGYAVISGDKAVVATYLKLPADPDHLKTVEDALKTIELL